MKHLFNLFPRLVAVAAVALSFGSCNRAEYAMLPKTSSYHATYGTIKAASAPAVVNEEVTENKMPAAQATEKKVAVEIAPAAVVASKTLVAAPVVANTRSVGPAAVEPTSRKLNLVQRAALAKVSKKIDKLATKAQVGKRTEAASHEDAQALNRYIKLGLLFLLVGLLVGIVFGLLGYILAIIGVVFLVLGLLEEV